jgi:hypothetical protein
MKTITLLFAICLAVSLHAQTNIVWSDGTRFFTKGGGGGVTNAPYGWDDILASANTAYTSGQTDIEQDDALGGKSFKTSATTNKANDHLTFTLQAPHSRKKGTDIYPHLHFWQTNADQTNMWYCYYNITGVGHTNETEIFSGVASNRITYAGGTMHQLASFQPITGLSNGVSSIIRIKLHRQGNIGTGAVTVTDLDCHVLKDGFGSDSETGKSY